MNTMDVGIMYTAPDENSVYMTAEQLPDGLTVHVTGLTSNKYWVADVGAGVPYYFNYEGLISENTNANLTTTATTPAVSTPTTQDCSYEVYKCEFYRVW